MPTRGARALRHTAGTRSIVTPHRTPARTAKWGRQNFNEQKLVAHFLREWLTVKVRGKSFTKTIKACKFIPYTGDTSSSTLDGDEGLLEQAQLTTKFNLIIKSYRELPAVVEDKDSLAANKLQSSSAGIGGGGGEPDAADGASAALKKRFLGGTMKLEAQRAWARAFAACGIPYRVMEDPWFRAAVAATIEAGTCSVAMCCVVLCLWPAHTLHMAA